MKNLFFATLVAVITMFTSCTENEIIIKYVPCTFNSASFVGDIVETRTITETKQITCHFPTALGEKTFTKNVGERFTVQLPAGETATAYFVHAKDVTPTINNTINVTTSGEDTYNAIWTDIPVYNKLYEVNLKRSVGKYTGKTGDIPAGYSLKIYANGAKQFNWLNPSFIDIENNSHLTSNSNLPFSAYIVGGENNIKVIVKLLNANNKEVKSGEFTYSIPANMHHTVTYNATTHTEGGFVVTIDETPMKDTSEDNTIN